VDNNKSDWATQHYGLKTANNWWYNHPRSNIPQIQKTEKRIAV